MRKCCALRVVAFLLGTVACTPAKAIPPPAGYRTAALSVLGHELPAKVPDGFARADTLNFGYFQVIDGNAYAVLGESWTFDHGTPSLEGWHSIDETMDAGVSFRQITAESWAGHGNQVAAPIINGTGSVWVGISEDAADSLCWESGLGYGNNWCQRLTSPDYTYTGTGNVHIEFKYFEDSEYKFDYGKVLVTAAGDTIQLNPQGGFSGRMGLHTAPLTYARDILPAELGGEGPARPMRIIFEFKADGGWSDQDGYYTTAYGPMGIDDFSISGGVTTPASNTWDSDLEGWTPSACPGLGSYMAVHPLSLYSSITFPFGCQLDGTVLAFHDETFHHPRRSQESGWSPPVDRTAFQAYDRIFCDWDQYSDLPANDGVHYRPGWSYYPYLCPTTGEYLWSGRRGQDVWYYTGDTPMCGRLSNIATDWGIPANCQSIAFVYEICTSCDVFGIPWDLCTNDSNASPILDNVQIRMTQIYGPEVAFGPGDSYADGFPMGDALNVAGLGNADVARVRPALPNVNDNPWRMGDSLVIVGPAPTESTRWEAKLWFRVRREGPGQMSIWNYQSWKSRVADGRNIVGPDGQFTFGWMDSVEAASVSKSQFDSYFREDDDDYRRGSSPRPDINEANEIIQDQILTPGTKIEYFITSDYICAPTKYAYYPDTTGRNTFEFEILPSYRTDPETGTSKFPCILYVNAADAGRRGPIERSLSMALHGVPAAQSWDIPDPAKWDRYDYQYATSTIHAPMIRNSGGNNGAALAQLLGYRMIIVDAGTDPAAGSMDYRDWQGLDSWLSASTCDGNFRLQGFWATGDNVAGIINSEYPSFLNNRLGAALTCDRYAEADCPPGKPADENTCVRLSPAEGAAWTPGLDLDLYGNWSPEQYGFDVISATGTGSANKAYERVGGGLAHEAQVVNDQAGSSGNYRSVIDGYAISHAIERLGSDPNGECAYDSSRALSAASDEVSNILKWTMNTADPLSLGLCVDFCTESGTPTNPGGGLVNRLSQNRPNPFNPSTAIRYSLAQAGPAALVIYDVNGRRVKTLVDRLLTAGPHVAVWDGLDEAGHKVPAGVYWSQLTAGSYTSNKKTVVVR